MKILGNKFLSLENKINQKIKQKQNYLKQKEEAIKNTGGKGEQDDKKEKS